MGLSPGGLGKGDIGKGDKSVDVELSWAGGGGARPWGRGRGDRLGGT